MAVLLRALEEVARVEVLVLAVVDRLEASPAVLAEVLCAFPLVDAAACLPLEAELVTELANACCPVAVTPATHNAHKTKYSFILAREALAAHTDDNRYRT